MFILDACTPELRTLVSIIKGVLQLIQIAIPIGLIVWGTLDLGRAVIASKEDEIKKNQQLLIKRAITAVLVFLVAAIVMFLMGFVGNNSWKNCWTNDAGCDHLDSVTGVCVCPAGKTYDASEGKCK